MKKYAVIVAGGAGVRMHTTTPKQFLLLQGRPMLWHTVTAFLTAFNDLKIILVLPQQFIEAGDAIIKAVADPQRVQLTAGGDTRFQSVKNGLTYIEKKSVVFVHDGVRCLVTPGLIQRCYETALEKGNAVPAIKVTDSLRMEKGNGNEAIDRNHIRIIQTPQTFLSDILIDAFEKEYDASCTDEAMVVEKLGIKINLVEGEAGNIKITNPVDLRVAERLLDERGDAFLVK